MWTWTVYDSSQPVPPLLDMKKLRCNCVSKNVDNLRCWQPLSSCGVPGPAGPLMMIKISYSECIPADNKLFCRQPGARMKLLSTADISTPYPECVDNPRPGAGGGWQQSTPGHKHQSPGDSSCSLFVTRTRQPHCTGGNVSSGYGYIFGQLSSKKIRINSIFCYLTLNMSIHMYCILICCFVIYAP